MVERSGAGDRPRYCCRDGGRALLQTGLMQLLRIRRRVRERGGRRRSHGFLPKPLKGQSCYEPRWWKLCACGGKTRGGLAWKSEMSTGHLRGDAYKLHFSLCLCLCLYLEFRKEPQAGDTHLRIASAWMVSMDVGMDEIIK